MVDKFLHFFKTLYRRAILLGAAIPPDQAWRAYVPAGSSLLGLALFSAVVLTDLNIELWRAMLGWSLIGACSFGIVFGIGWIQGYHRRDEIAPERPEALEEESSDSIRIALAISFTAPPIARFILSLLGWDP
ncbi:MAG: hypothetical protein ACR2QJ_05510 [Geminicoccaceae bacterium]